jgi:hypothetical protein
MNQNVLVRLSAEDKKVLSERAKSRRLKLSTYLRYELTKNIDSNG